MRHITYGGKNSLDDFGLRINSERSGAPGLAGQRTPTMAIPHRNGDIVQTAGLESAPLDYCFIIRGSGRAACEEKMRAVMLWLSGRCGELIDSDFPGKKYMGAVMSGAPEVEWVSRNFMAAYYTVHMVAEPIMQELNAVNERVLKFPANGDCTLTITNNSAYTIVTGSTTKTGSFTAAEPYKYRLTACTENPAEITLNDAALLPDSVFTMPTSAEIEITNTGYGYYELWHDTRQGVGL